MTIEEMKTALLTSHDEGVDPAAAYDSVLSEVSGIMTALEDEKRKVEDLTNRVAELTDNNLKLLDKVKYMAQDEPEGQDEEVKEVTIENLFEEE